MSSSDQVVVLHWDRPVPEIAVAIVSALMDCEVVAGLCSDGMGPLALTEGDLCALTYGILCCEPIVQRCLPDPSPAEQACFLVGLSVLVAALGDIRRRRPVQPTRVDVHGRLRAAPVRA
jgi:hypothetical protein